MRRLMVVMIGGLLFASAACGGGEGNRSDTLNVSKPSVAANSTTPEPNPTPTATSMPNPTPVATPITTPVATPVATPVVTSIPTPVAAPSPAIQSREASLSEDFRIYLTENFGAPGFQTSWWRYIVAVSVDSDAAVVDTSLTSVTELGGAAMNICGSASSYVFDQTRKHGLKRVVVRGPSGRVLINRGTISQPCR